MHIQWPVRHVSIAKVAERDSLRNCIARVNCWFCYAVPIRGGDGNGDSVAGIGCGRGQYNGRDRVHGMGKICGADGEDCENVVGKGTK